VKRVLRRSGRRATFRSPICGREARCLQGATKTLDAIADKAIEGTTTITFNKVGPDTRDYPAGGRIALQKAGGIKADVEVAKAVDDPDRTTRGLR